MRGGQDVVIDAGAEDCMVAGDEPAWKEWGQSGNGEGADDTDGGGVCCNSDGAGSTRRPSKAAASAPWAMMPPPSLRPQRLAGRSQMIR